MLNKNLRREIKNILGCYIIYNHKYVLEIVGIRNDSEYPIICQCFNVDEDFPCFDTELGKQDKLYIRLNNYKPAYVRIHNSFLTLPTCLVSSDLQFVSKETAEYYLSK